MVRPLPMNITVKTRRQCWPALQNLWAISAMTPLQSKTSSLAWITSSASTPPPRPPSIWPCMIWLVKCCMYLCISCSVLTLGIDSPVNMAKKALAARDYPIFKVKVGTKHDLDNLKAIREVSSATIRVDANTAWTPKEAIKMINALTHYNIEFVEQPIAPRDLTGLKLIRDNVPVPIIAAESCVTVEDIPRIAGCVDGINIKLMKCGGIHHALKMIYVARAHNLRVMIGCMIESSLAITAAAHLTPLVDYADLDGHLLIDNDPYEGVKVVNGKLVLPDAPGLGVKVRE